MLKRGKEMKLAVVTDSTAYLPERIQDHADLFVIPIPVILDGKSYNEGIDIQPDEYYSLLKNSKEFPKTSQPVLGEVIALYETLAQKGYDTILSIHLSSGISGFINTLYGIKDDIKGARVIPYDSKITSMPMGHMVEAALDLNQQGKTIEEIVTHIDRIRDNTYAYLIVDDLNNLYEKIRSSKKAFNRAEDIIGQRESEIAYPVKFYVIHANNLSVALEEKAKLQKKYPDAEIEVGHFGPVIGSHLGEKAIGIAIAAQ